ncbi:MAG: glycosyltransferase [Akkermansiaceae bacterium]|nr:glycosyltransferase [Akkermansiaceae bacterium]
MRHKDQSQRANQMAVAVQNGTYTPAVDVLIPTYNEPLFILERTLVGCQAMTYANKTIFVLDDTNRPDVAALSADLGCQYIARPEHTNAKAGNLNYAIAQTTGDLIAVFDADFIPTENFLHRTVGFFQSETMGLVQTPKAFTIPIRSVGTWAGLMSSPQTRRCSIATFSRFAAVQAAWSVVAPPSSCVAALSKK